MPTRRKHRQHRPTPTYDVGAYELARKREIVSRFGTWETCGRWACWRARACRDPKVACFEEQRDTVEDLIVDEAYANYRLAGIAEEMLPEAE